MKQPEIKKMKKRYEKKSVSKKNEWRTTALHPQERRKRKKCMPTTDRKCYVKYKEEKKDE
jgi:hypothetical protein